MNASDQAAETHANVEWLKAVGIDHAACGLYKLSTRQLSALCLAINTAITVQVIKAVTSK